MRADAHTERARTYHRRIGGMDLPVMPPVKPMLAKAVKKIPPGMQYEAKWDGFRAIVHRDGDEVEVGSRTGKSLTRYFPELVAALKENLPPRCVVDGEIVVVHGGRLDFDRLSERIHPAASRVKLLAGTTPASFVAFDLLALGDESLLDSPLGERRSALVHVLSTARPPVHLAPATTDPVLAREWFERFEGAGLDGVVAKPLDLPYRPDARLMFKVGRGDALTCRNPPCPASGATAVQPAPGTRPGPGARRPAVMMLVMLLPLP